MRKGKFSIFVLPNDNGGQFLDTELFDTIPTHKITRDPTDPILDAGPAQSRLMG